MTRRRRQLGGGKEKTRWFRSSRLKLLGRYVGDQLVGVILFIALVVVDGFASWLVALLPLVSDDVVFLKFAEFMHLLLMAADGFLFVWAVLYLLVRAIKEGKDE